jgi:aspartokinase/homoserine dehydrogenase 1
MKVMKFGGTSSGTPESMLLVKNIIEKEREPVIVVVSALGGVTDRLLLAADFALNTNPGYQSVLEEIIFRHHEMIEKMVPSASDKQELKQKIEPMFEDLRNILRVFISSVTCRKRHPTRSSVTANVSRR